MPTNVWLKVRVLPWSQDIPNPPTDDVERFLAMIQFNSKGKLESLPNFQVQIQLFFEELGLSLIPNFFAPKRSDKRKLDAVGSSTLPCLILFLYYLKRLLI
jgi:hypothetical protein